MKPKVASNPRIAAIHALDEVINHNRNLADSEALTRIANRRDNAFARHLAYGIVRWLTALEWLADKLLARPLKPRDRDIRFLVLLGLQQLWHDRTADHAAVNETAECARLLGKPWAVGLLNAVLRRFQRERVQWLQQLAGVEDRLAHPSWLLSEIRSDWPGDWQRIIEANNLQAPLWLRLNRQKVHRAEVREELHSAGFETAIHPHAADAIRIEPPAPVEQIPGFARGWLSVQDPAAQLARDLVDPAPGDRVLDACAAPGGKTAHLLESCPRIQLTALDKAANRVGQIHQNLQRLGLSAKTRVADALEPDSWWDGVRFNKILLDAPCSATGVIRRHPEIKWLRNKGQVDEVVMTQAALLETLWPLLETGGKLVYATCSVLKRENQRQLQRFLRAHEGARMNLNDPGWGTAGPHGCQVFPGDAGMDGFFYAVLQKYA